LIRWKKNLSIFAIQTKALKETKIWISRERSSSF